MMTRRFIDDEGFGATVKEVAGHEFVLSVIAPDGRVLLDRVFPTEEMAVGRLMLDYPALRAVA